MGSRSPSPSSSPTASPPSNTLNPLPPSNTNPNRTRTSNPPVISPAPPPVPSALPPSPPSEAPIPDPPPPASPPLKPPASSPPPQGPPPAASSPLPPPESPSSQPPSPSAAAPAATPQHSRPRSLPASPPARTPTASAAPPVAALPHTPPATPAATAAPPPGASHQPQLPTARSVQPIRNISADNGSVGSQGLRSGSIIAVSSFVGFLALTLAVFFVWFVNRRKKINGGPNIDQPVPSVFASSHNTDSTFLRPQYSNITCSSDAGRGASSRSWLTYEDLSEATNGFSGDNLLGQGGFGCVYKGVLMDGRPVAVKQLKAGSRQGEREFRAEVDIISRIHHRHLVSLVGYCIFENQRLLVYDYVPNNNLHYHLHGEGKPVMDWASRVKVAAGAARGLAYLHEDCQPRIIHRDIKSTNILLDNNFEARVADFGLAKLAQELDINTHVSTRVMGTFGYLAPEYASTGKLTEKSDVYSFGVVLLELITGREPVDSSQPSGDESLVEWARPLLAQALETQVFEELVDPRLDNNFNEREMFRLIESAAASIRHSASRRPRMSQIARALESMDELESLTSGIEMGQSGVFDSREHSAQIRRFDRMAFGNDDYYSSSSFSRSQNSWRS